MNSMPKFRWNRTVLGNRAATSYCFFAGAPGSTAATPSGLMLEAKNINGSLPGFPHWCTRAYGSFASLAMSQKCHYRKSPMLLDHLVGALELNVVDLALPAPCARRTGQGLN